MNTKISKEKLEEILAKEHACYVLITCDHPDSEGHMQVNMTYQGDQALASYLVDGAQAYLDSHEETELVEKSLKIMPQKK